MKKRRIMLDGSTVGAELSGSLELEASEVYKVHKILKKRGGEDRDSGFAVTVNGLVISLRTHYHDKSKYFLNLTGNALKFLTGSNVYGYVEADQIIVKAFIRALDGLGKFPDRIIEAIEARMINVHSLEFAVYTNEVPNKKLLLNDWAHVYQAGYSNSKGDNHESLTDMLRIKFARAEWEHKSSVCLRIWTKDGREEEIMLQVYDKAQQIRDVSEEAVPKDIKNRLRIDLHLHHGWFRRRSVNGTRLKTLKDIADYVEKRGGWTLFVATELKYALERTCLFHMWSFDPQPIKRGTYKRGMPGYFDLDAKVYDALWDRRLNLRVTDEARRLRNLGKGAAARAQQVPDPHPEKLKLDLKPL